MILGASVKFFVIPDLIGNPWPNAQAMDSRFRGNDNEVGCEALS
jgi:hypothetical protein